MAETSPPRRANTTSTIERVALVLEELSRHPGGTGPREIARATGVDRSAASRMLAVLRDAGFASQEVDSGPYVAGVRLKSLAARLRGHDGTVAIARPIVDRLRDAVDETVTFVTGRTDDARHLVVAESTRPVRFAVAEGSDAAGGLRGYQPPVGDTVRHLDDPDSVWLVAAIDTDDPDASDLLVVAVPRSRATAEAIRSASLAVSAAARELRGLLP